MGSPVSILQRFFMSDDLQPWIDLSSNDEQAWIQARYDRGGLPPGITSRMAKADVKRGRAKSRRSRKNSPPAASSDWQRLVGWMREFSSDPSE
jgi:hypothetical protein